MTDITTIERQIEGLDDEALARLRDWFIAYDHDRWDRRIADDADAGRLDALIEEALADHRAGKTRQL